MPSLFFWLSFSSLAVMLPAIFFQLLLGWSWPVKIQGASAQSEFNNPPGVDIWCGKAYKETNSSFDPGGWLYPPEPVDGHARLDLRVYPRYNFYLAGEKKGEFIIDTPVQTSAGTAYKNETFDYKAANKSEKVPFTWMNVQITNIQTKAILVNWTRIPVNTTGNVVKFDLSSFPADLSHPWTVNAIGASPDGLQTYYSGAQVSVLPPRNDAGSVARIDNLHGGIQTQSSLTNGTWKTLFPYSFYTSWDWISSTITNTSSTKNLTTFRSLGYNLIHPVPPGGSDPFDAALFDRFLTICDSLSLYVMYDMRHTYRNTTSVSLQLSRLQHHPSLLLYYTADEPDGHSDPLNATRLSYAHIRSLDPYHPVSLVLNCANFHFEAYTSGAADIILEDVYPIAVNTSFSTVYHTTCNTTYGDCGCDNCHANDPDYPSYVRNPFLDISTRVDALYAFQGWLKQSGGHEPQTKPIWGVPQAFFDEGSFWTRWPTGREELVMAMLRVVHGAKGIVAWIYPTSGEIEDATAGLARVFDGGGGGKGEEDVAAFVLGAKRTMLVVEGGDGLVDAAAWIKGSVALVAYVHMSYKAFEVAPGTGKSGIFQLRFPDGMDVGDHTGRVKGIFGGGMDKGWSVFGSSVGADGTGGAVARTGNIEGLEVGMFKVSVQQYVTDGISSGHSSM